MVALGSVSLRLLVEPALLSEPCEVNEAEFVAYFVRKLQHQDDATFLVTIDEYMEAKCPLPHPVTLSLTFIRTRHGL